MERDDIRQTERDLSAAYLRLRALIPGAYDTPVAPSPEQVWATTETALRRVLQELDDARRSADVAIRHPLTREYEAPRDPAEQLKLRGVGRVADEPRALLVLLSERPTDDEIRSLRDYLLGWPLRNGSLLAGTNPGDTPARTGGTP